MEEVVEEEVEEEGVEDEWEEIEEEDEVVVVCEFVDCVDFFDDLYDDPSVLLSDDVDDDSVAVS